MYMTTLRRVLREPFLHFVLLGAALFGVSEYLEARAKYTEIHITPDAVRGIAENYRLQYGSAPAPGQLAALVDAYTREEVFYHEALKLGLDKDDEIIRRRLVQKYEFLQQDLGVTREPTDAELEAFYRQHTGRYRVPPKVAFTQVYFSPDAHGEAGARAQALKLAQVLNARGVTRAPQEGDRFPGPTDFAALSAEELVRVFGKDGLASEIFNQTPHRWVAPLRSGLGWHLVYVNERLPEQLATFEEARDTVRRDYLESERAGRNERVYAKLKRGFTVVQR